MHPKSNASSVAGQPVLDLVLERLPDGSYAWLRPVRLEPIEECRYVLTDAGRRDLAMNALYGQRQSAVT